MTTDWREIESRVFMTTGRRMPVVVVRGEGTRVWDDAGKPYLDFFGGPAVHSLGHCHPVLVKAIEEQARTLIHVSNAVYSVPQLQLAQLLIDNSCFDRVYFQNSGTEANEAAIKLARKWGRERKRGAYEIISAVDSFHGRTLAAVTATGTTRYSEPFVPLPAGFTKVMFGDIEAIEMATTPDTCAIILEPIQGEGGVNVPDPSYFPSLREWCDEQKILLMVDEVQTGMCRTGPLFAYQGMGFEPDVMTLAKGLGGGVPVGAILAKEDASIFTPGDHGSTFGGNPLATAAAYAVTKYMLENDMPARVARLSDYFFDKLETLQSSQPLISGVRGKGLLLAIGLTKDVAERVTMECLSNGLIVNNVRPNAVRLAPPLTVSEAEIDEAVAVIETALASAEA
ncbi:MAG: acetylornithine/succinylornithine family transaminase [Dehalococcoidia bacterium]|nr:acetylornithine/succinylornithine family transaminase [Dehalococcoidia bacterium]